jgi:uncharacterized membrane protein
MNGGYNVIKSEYTANRALDQSAKRFSRSEQLAIKNSAKPNVTRARIERAKHEARERVVGWLWVLGSMIAFIVVIEVLHAYRPLS